MDKRHNLGAIRQERLLHGGHVLAELVAFGRKNGEMGLLSRAGKDTPNIQRIGLGVKGQQGRISGLVDGNGACRVKEHPLFSHRVPATSPGELAPHVAQGMVAPHARAAAAVVRVAASGVDPRATDRRAAGADVVARLRVQNNRPAEPLAKHEPGGTIRDGRTDGEIKQR
eukprot:200455-Amphidinium_carterae.1